MSRPLEVATFPALGTTATLLVTEAEAGDEALALLRAELAAIDLACSRFRPDSELVSLNEARAEMPVKVSPLLLEAVLAGIRAAEITDGLVDPTVGNALELIGYDRDFAAISPQGPPLTFVARPVPGWQTVIVDPDRSTVRLRPGVRIDLGATAKALSSDRAATAIAEKLGVGALVSLGGDISVSGPPPADGWTIKISHNHSDALDSPGPTVDIRSGGLATSSTSVRRWHRGDVAVHHLIDPRTSRSVPEIWTLVSVAAGSCLDANIASCAAMIMGEAAPSWLETMGLPARLETPDGRVTTVGGWPADPSGTAPSTGDYQAC